MAGSVRVSDSTTGPRPKPSAGPSAITSYKTAFPNIPVFGPLNRTIGIACIRSTVPTT